MSACTTHVAALMGTVVSLRVPHGEGPAQHEPGPREREERVGRALSWFRRVEACCSRFEEGSELRRLSGSIGRPVPVSAMLYELVEFALAVAEESGGAFDPTVGLTMEGRGFDREYRSGRVARTPLRADESVTYRDVRLDQGGRTITLTRPLLLDLGAVAKGLAVDMAARELEPLGSFTIDAGGDLWLGGRNAEGAPWSVGIRHPRDPDGLIATLRVSDGAVCTSGDYERPSHILDPRRGAPAEALASVTVVAPSAMVADALGTAAFVLGPERGLELLERQRVEALLVTPSLERITTPGMELFDVPAAGTGILVS